MRSAFSGLCINGFATLPKQSPRLFYSNSRLLKPLKFGACYAIQWQVSQGLKHYWHRHTARAATLASSPMGMGTDMDKYMSRVEQVEEALGRPLDSGPQAPPPQPLVIVISGPSGVGKDAVIKRLQECQRNLHFVVTATTRTKRPGEVDGKDYYFLKRDEFLSLIEKDELLEHALVYGDYKGIPKQQIREYREKGYDVLLRVDVQGAATLKGILEDSAVFIFLVAESEVALVKRLMERKTEYKDKLLLRISTAQEEMKQIKNFDYVVVNSEGQLDKTVELIQSIICAEKARVQQRAVQI